MRLNLEPILTIIEEHYSEPDFTAEHIAERMGISYSYLREEMKLHFGVTPSHLIESVRLYHGLELLFRNDREVHAVARQVGYSHPRSFRVAFRKRLGLCPADCLNNSDVTGQAFQVLSDKLFLDSVKSVRQKHPSDLSLAQG